MATIPTIPMARFVDFVQASGMQRVTKVREFRYQRDDARGDFYRQVREAIVKMHRDAQGNAALDHFLADQRDERRRRIYPGVVGGYRRFLRSAQMVWFDPPTNTYLLRGLDIGIDPELGLVIEGKTHIIKMYFGAAPLSLTRVTAILNLLATGLDNIASPKATYGLLDVRMAKLHTFRAPNPRLNLLFRAEADAFSTLYQSL